MERITGDKFVSNDVNTYVHQLAYLYSVVDAMHVGFDCEHRQQFVLL